MMMSRKSSCRCHYEHDIIYHAHYIILLYDTIQYRHLYAEYHAYDETWLFIWAIEDIWRRISLSILFVSLSILLSSYTNITHYHHHYILSLTHHCHYIHYSRHIILKAWTLSSFAAFIIAISFTITPLFSSLSSFSTRHHFYIIICRRHYAACHDAVIMPHYYFHYYYCWLNATYYYYILHTRRCWRRVLREMPYLPYIHRLLLLRRHRLFHIKSTMKKGHVETQHTLLAITVTAALEPYAGAYADAECMSILPLFTETAHEDIYAVICYRQTLKPLLHICEHIRSMPFGAIVYAIWASASGELRLKSATLRRSLLPIVITAYFHYIAISRCHHLPHTLWLSFHVFVCHGYCCGVTALTP